MDFLTNQRGFIQIPLLIVITIGFLILSGEGYVRFEQYQDRKDNDGLFVSEEFTKNLNTEFATENNQSTSTPKLSEVEKLKNEVAELKSKKEVNTKTSEEPIKKAYEKPILSKKEKTEINKEKIIQTPPPQKPELYLGKDQFIFIPVNWNRAKGDFDISVSAAMKEFKKQYLELQKRAFPLLDSDEAYFNSRFEAINLTNCIDICRLERLPTSGFDLENLCSNQCLDKKRLYDPYPTFIGISNDEKFFGKNFQEYLTILVDLRNLRNVSTVVHEIGHLFWSLCDEYKYSLWQQQDKYWPEFKGVKGCPNPYPLTCADHPQWINNEENYLTYVHGLGLTWGGYKQTTTDEKIEKETGIAFCPGAVCTPQAGYDQCRSTMGPTFTPDDILYFFGGKLETRIPIEAILPPW